MKTKKTKSWAEKYQTRTQPEIKRIDKAFADIPEGGLMLIATPQIIENYLREIPAGTSVNLKTLRQDLALAHNAEYTCPVTTGIFLRIVAEANYEAYQNGKPLNEIAPFWRVIDEKMPIAKKLSFGVDFIKENRAQELS
ncbi:MAG: hypothetical protein ACK4TA_20700 [Saprospiraceae bacterium]